MSAMYGYTESRHALNARRVQIHIDTDLPAPEYPTSRWSPSTVELPAPEITVDPPSASRSSEDSLWIDRTSLSTGVFDSDRDSCVFDALDEELLHHPVQCFADVCWAEAVSRTDSRRASRIRRREQEEEEEDVQPQPIASTGAGTDSRAVHWADDETTVEVATTLAQVHAAPRIFLDEASGLVPLPLPFSDKLNIVAPTERLAADPAASSHSYSAKPPASEPYVHPASANPRQDPFVLNLNLNRGAHFTPADPSESIGFFPTPRRAAPNSKSKSSAKIPGSGSRFKLFAYFHTTRRV